MTATATLTPEQDKALNIYVDRMMAYTSAVGKAANAAAHQAGEPVASPEVMAQKPDISELLREELIADLTPQFSALHGEELEDMMGLYENVMEKAMKKMNDAANAPEMPEYQVALVLTVKAPSYEEALSVAKSVAEGTDEENIYAVTDYEEDNDGQRVLYLPTVE